VKGHQTVPLARAFLARFFDNEITGGTNDLQQSFFWLVAFLAAPGACMSVWMSARWEFIARYSGADVLRTVSAADKVLYLGFTMIGTAIVTVLAWQSLMVDRRDAIVLGALPVSHRVIIRAKLLALASYIGVIVLAMHLLSAVGFGVFLAATRESAFAARGVVAHFAGSTAGSLFVFLAAIAVQGTVLTAVGPRGFARVSALLQLVVVGAILLSLIALPEMSVSVVDTIRGTGPAHHPWMLLTPPLWFLGVYEAALGTRDPVLLELSRTGWLALAGAAAVASLSYPLAYRRVMRDAVQHADGLGPVGRFGAPARWLPAVLGCRASTRASAEFLLATLGRVERHRFAVAVSAGVALAWATPTVLDWQRVTTAWSPADQRAVLSLPISGMAFMLVGFRVAMSMPSDLRGRWIFQAADPPRRAIRAAVRRVLLALVVVPAAALAAATGILLWGTGPATRHASITAAAGLLITEYLVRDLDLVPCSAPWRPERANLRALWPGYVIACVLVCGAGPLSLAALDLASFQSAALYAAVLAAMMAGAARIRWKAGRRAVETVEDSDTVTVVGVLDLN
jgi:hypothetical protein